MATTAIHSTPKKNIRKIRKQGLKSQPFWRSRIPVRSPKKFRFRYPAFVHSIEGKSFNEKIQMVYDSLRAANLHITGTSRTKFRLDKISILIVDLNKSKFIGKNIVNGPLNKKTYGMMEEVALEAPRNAIKHISLGKKTIKEIEKATKDMKYEEANRYIAEAVAKKIEEKNK